MIAVLTCSFFCSVQSGGQQREQRWWAPLPFGIWRQAPPRQCAFLSLQRTVTQLLEPCPCSSQLTRQKKRKEKEKKEFQGGGKGPGAHYEERDPYIICRCFFAAGFFRSKKVNTQFLYTIYFTLNVSSWKHVAVLPFVGRALATRILQLGPKLPFWHQSPATSPSYVQAKVLFL